MLEAATLRRNRLAEVSAAAEPEGGDAPARRFHTPVHRAVHPGHFFEGSVALHDVLYAERWSLVNHTPVHRPVAETTTASCIPTKSCAATENHS